MNPFKAHDIILTMDQTNPVYLVANVDSTAQARREQFEGTEHLVVPVIAAQSQVMNGLYYPPEEFDKWAITWNGVPVPVRHPRINGQPVSAKNPSIQEVSNIGWFYNVKFSENKLKGELWLNIEKAARLGFEYIINKLEAGEVMEVSTGLFHDSEPLQGSFNGVEYTKVVRNIRPDHVAILPDEKGACSVEQGCGAMRVNCSCEEKPKENTLKTAFVEAFNLVKAKLGFKTNEAMSFSEIESQLRNWAEATYQPPQGFVWTIEVYEDHFIFMVDGQGTDKMYRANYALKEGQVEVLGAEEVERKVTYQPVPQANNDGGVEMTQQQETVEVQQVPATQVNEIVAQDEDMKAYMENAAKEFIATKDKMVQELMANSAFSKEELEAFSFNALKKMHDSVVKPAANTALAPTANYQGRPVAGTLEPEAPKAQVNSVSTSLEELQAIIKKG